jgi:hypothetical protein
MADPARTRLPSERSRPGDPRQIGFQADPPEEHVERAAAAVRSVAELVSMPRPGTARPRSSIFGARIGAVCRSTPWTYRRSTAALAAS